MKFFNRTKFNNFGWLFSFMMILLLACFIVQNSFASAKEYRYQNFEVDIAINQDSTFDVTEKQTYYLNGNFGYFYRDVSLNKIDAVTDVEVFGENGNRIPKNELEIKSINGAKRIKWNFRRRDFNKEEKGWIVKYKVHGGISFLNGYDEIYWNAVPRDRNVPIKNVKVTVSLENRKRFRSDLIQLYAEDIPNPLNSIAGSQLNCESECTNSELLKQDCLQCGLKHNFEPTESNLTSTGGYYFNQDNTKAIFWGKNIKPNTNFTIAAGFSKGIVSKSEYWKDFLLMYYGYILSILILLSAFLYGLYYWYKTEKSREGKHAIVPQYEPPQNIRPAMAEVIVKEKLTNKGLSATIIDLAVRGHVKIEEEEKSKLERFLSSAGVIFPMLILFAPFIVILFLLSLLFEDKNVIYILSFLFIVLFLISIKILKSFNKKRSDYLIKKIKPHENDYNLKDYEKKYLQAFFSNGEYFSTKELKKSPTKSEELYFKIQTIKDNIYKETELYTKAFEVGLVKEKYIGAIFMAIIFGAFIIISVSGGIFTEFMQPLTLAITIIGSIIGLYAFIKYEARLSDDGIKLKEDLLGFKMYLETAEKYRMQNLKPEYFEKYLPYAMIFGVEKKWAKAFEAMNVPSPSWYSGAVATGVAARSSPAPSFSPTLFSASFTSSFTSAFSSSGVGGASGGGGGAGGGGGGGGGGAG